MISRIRRHIGTRRDERGLTLIEMLVSMGIFALIMGMITTAIVTMLGTSQRTAGQATNLEGGTRVIQRLDHQVRYANAISEPGTGADGNYYVEYSNGNFGGSQLCTQWRYVTTSSSLQFRTWSVSSTGSLSGSASSWATMSTRVQPVGSTSIFSITPNNTNQSSVDDKEQLTVLFQIASGTPTQTTQFQTTLTAFNSSSGTPPTSVCAQVGRPS